MKNLKDKVAAITGAASGIGKETALELARAGCHLAISDIDETGLKQTETEAKTLGVNISIHKLDVADKKAVYQWADTVVKEHGKVNIIMNNAGVGHSSTIEEMTYEDFEWVMNINFWGVVYGTKAFLPYLKEAEEGHIINISSVFGLFAVPMFSAYNASKFAIRGFTEALRQELEIDGCNVSCTSVHPGGISTNIARNGRLSDSIKEIAGSRSEAENTFDSMAFTNPEQAARGIVNALKRNNRRVLIGKDAIVFDIFQRALPATYQKIVTFGVKLQRKKNQAQ